MVSNGENNISDATREFIENECRRAEEQTATAVRLSVDTGDVDAGWDVFEHIPAVFMAWAYMTLVDIVQHVCDINPPPGIAFVTPMFEDENGTQVSVSDIDDPALLLAGDLFSARLSRDVTEFLRVVEKANVNPQLSHEVRANAWAIAITTIAAARAGERVWWEVDERGNER